MTVNELPLRHIKCSYLNPQANNIKSCHISYWPNGTYGDLSYATGQQFTNNSIDIDLPPFPKFYNETLFLYRVTANDGRVSVIVEGAFHAGKTIVIPVPGPVLYF